MKPQMIAILAIYTFFIILEMWRTGFFKKPGARNGDATVEVVSTAALTMLTQPLALFLGGATAALLFPTFAGSLSGLPVWAAILLFLVFDDMTQYWWHRLSHENAWLYNLHRPHHNAQYLSVRVVYRNNFFYYLMMPGLWLSGALVYLGLGWVYAGYIVVKMTVIIAAHCDVRWDQPLYKNRLTRPIMWVLERTISTPTTHAAHHGRHASDGVTHYKGNYGNLLFFWDVLFGTARITRQVPSQFGVENLPETSVGEQLFWPVVRSVPDKQSAEPRQA
ncbi:MAG: sterol desaturase family protein [Pseudomonadota bacterium]